MLFIKNKPVDHDNRGDKSEPFEFVYFDDGSRLVYALGKVHSEEAPVELRQMAMDYLAGHGIVVTLL